MVDFVKEGTSYKVISDSYNYFKLGDIVVALESDDVPYCCHKKDYHGPVSYANRYANNKVHALTHEELEEIE